MRRGHHYSVVLGMILASLVFQLAAPNADWARLGLIIVQGATLLVILWVAGANPWLRHAASVVVAIAVAASAGALLGNAVGAAPARAVPLLLVAVAPASIIVDVTREVRRRHLVTVRTMFGVLCVYLLIGSFFAYGYGLIGDLSSTPFFTARVHPTQADYTYFSFATLTTVGYGDLTAQIGLGRSLAIAEALLGQIYLVTVVAVIVGNLGRGPGSRPGVA
jgi:hypothetical protein